MFVFAAVMIALVSALLWARWTDNARLEWITKPAAAATFVFAAVYVGALRTDWGTIILCGLVLAAIGDVLLIPKNKRAFGAGLVSFLLGHEAYAVAFWVRGVDLAWVAAASALAARNSHWCRVPWGSGQPFGRPRNTTECS